MSLSSELVVVEFSGVGSSSPNGESSRKNSEPSAEFIHSRYDELHDTWDAGMERSSASKYSAASSDSIHARYDDVHDPCHSS